MTIAEAHGVSLQFSGVESHNALGNSERYQTTIRLVFQIFAKNESSLSNPMPFRYAIKKVNDTGSIDGLMTSLLVFGFLPNFPISN